jgi:uncharacterized protein YjdB
VTLSGTGTAPPLVSIAITPASPSVAAGITQQFTATGTYSNGTTQNLVSTAKWSSSTTTVATVKSGTGLAMGVAPGTTTITATLGAISGSATLTVTAAVLTSLSVTPATASVAAGKGQQFTATGTYSNGTKQNLTSTAQWASSATPVAAVSSTGLASGVAQGTATITATLGTIGGSAILTVTAPVLTSLSVTPATASVIAGKSQQFTATGTYSDGSTQNLTGAVTWTSSKTTVATVSDGGLATSAAKGTANIKATTGTITGAATLTVTAIVLTSISVTPTPASVAAGDTQQFTATGIYSDGSTQNLTTTATWTSSETAVATVSSRGLATSIAKGTANIKATSAGITGAATLTVTAAVLTSISLTPSTASVPAGKTEQFTAIGIYSDNTIQNLTNTATWTSSTTSIATVSSGGLASSLAQGTAIITATSGTISGSAPLMVTAAVITSLSVTPGSVSIAKGTSQQFTAIGTYSDGSTQNLTSAVKWTSSPTTVATVVPTSGLAAGVGIGTATITATSGSINASATLNVGQPTLVSLAITPANPSFALGTTQPFTATGTYSDGSTLDLTNSATWTTTDNTIATVNAQGLVTSVALGSTSVTATSGLISGSTTLTITPALLVSIAVTPAVPTIPLGTTQPFTATGTYTDGSTQSITGTVQWSSDTPTVATISNATGSQGVASSAGAEGTATITATVGSVSGSTTLNVTSAALVSLTITPATPTLALGTTQPFTATGTFTDGSTQNLTSTVTWASDTQATATITPAGLASSVGIGTANISATQNGVSASTLLTVTAAALVSIAINPPAATIPLGMTQPFTATGTFTDGTTQDVTQTGHWSSTVATVATISNTAATAGLATSLGTGTTTIGISSGSVSASAPLVVNPAALVSIAITPQTPMIALGTTQQFMATGTYTDGSTQDVTSVVTWSSSSATVAIISNSAGSYGLATSSGQGAVTITATSSSVTSSTTLTVGGATVSSIAVTPSSVSITQGTAEQFTAIATYTDGSTQDITQTANWASSIPSVASMTSTGLAISMLSGTTIVSARAGTATGSAYLTVNAPVPVSLVISPTTATAAAGAQLQFGATLFYSDGSSVNVTDTVTWSSSNPAVVLVNPATGLAACLTAGSSIITATWGTNVFTATASVTAYASNTFFVAANGNDSWTGDLAAPNSTNTDGPFASLSRAQFAVENAPKPATVIVRNGTYYLALTPPTANTYAGTLLFTSADSGTSSSAQVTWHNYPGETPVISGGVPANADPISGAGLHLQWSNTGNWYQAPLPVTLSNNAALQPFEYLYYNGQRRMRSRIHDNGTSPYPSIGYFMQNGQCVASPSTPAGQPSPTLASCNLGTFLRVTNTIAPTNPLGKNCPYESGMVNGVAVSKCLDRFIYTNTSGGDPIQAWQNLSSSYSGTPATPCTPNPASSYPPGDVELTLIDAWSVDVMRVNCVDTSDNVIFLLGPAKGGGTVASSNTNYNSLGPIIGHRYVIENTWDAFNDALTPTSSQYGITGIWFLDRHAIPWVLNYIANENETPNTDNIVIPQLGGSIPAPPVTDYIGGSLLSATNLKYVTFQGITFEVDNFYPNSVGFNNDVNGEMTLPQAIDCENCQFVTFNTVTVRHTSASGILAAATAATPACSGSNPPACVVIENSALYDLGDSGIRIGHTPSATDTTATVVQDVMAQNNLIQGYSRVFPDGEGIAEANGNNNQYSYNTITDGYHAGISICQVGCGPTKSGASVSGNGIISSYNLISDLIQGITSDGGALFYNIGGSTSSGTGNSVTNNVINNVTDSYIIDNPTTAGVTVVGSAYGGEGIYLDGQSADVKVTNNVVYNLSGHGIAITAGLASAKETQNSFTNNIFAFANSGMFVEQNPWPTGCPTSPIKQVDVINNIFYFDRHSTSTPSFYVIQGCRDSCKQAYDTFQNFQGNSYWRTDGQFASDSAAFLVLTTQGLNSNNTCKAGPNTSLYFSSQTAPDWQAGGTGVPVAMNEDLPPSATASYQPPFSGSGLATDLPTDYLFPTGQTPPTAFVPSNTNLTVTNAHSSVPPVGTVPPTFPVYVYGSPQNRF